MKSRFGGTLELFSSVKLTLFDKRHDGLASVSQVDISEPFAFLRGNIERISAASCMVALVDGVTADRDPSPSIFHRLLDGLRSLGQTDDPEFLAVVFQIQALGHAGFSTAAGSLCRLWSERWRDRTQVFPVGRRVDLWVV